MTRVKPRAIRLLKHDRIKILSAVFVSLLASACASTQKVDRVHASIYHQQTSIQQLQSDMQRVEKQRLQVATELERLQQDGSSNQQQIEVTRERLEALEAKQSDIAAVMSKVNSSVATNTRSISALKTSEQKRREIIKAQQLRWQQITAQTNTKLAEIENQTTDPARELNRGDSTDVQTR